MIKLENYLFAFYAKKCLASIFLRAVHYVSKSPMWLEGCSLATLGIWCPGDPDLTYDPWYLFQL